MNEKRKSLSNARFATVLAIAVSAMTAPANPVDGVLTVDVGSGDTRAYTDTELSAITEGTVTNILKTGAGALESASLGGYEGSFRVGGGVLKVKDGTGLGSTSAGSEVIVEDGATLEFLSNDSFLRKRFRIAGSGFAGTGALSAASTVKICNLTLDDGAVIGGAVGNNGVFYLVGGTLDMNGHSITQNLSSSAATFAFGYNEMSNPGDIVVRRGYLRIDNDLTGDVKGRILLQGGRLTRWSSSRKCNWPVFCDGHYPLTSFLYAGGTASYFWDGPLVLTNSVAAADQKNQTVLIDGGNRSSITTFALNGPITGDGDVYFGIIKAKCEAHVELNATNSYTGTTAAGWFTFLRAKFPEAIGNWNGFTVPCGSLDVAPSSSPAAGTGSAFVMDGRCDTNPSGWTGPQMTAMWEKYNRNDYPEENSHKRANVFAGARAGEHVTVTGAVFGSGVKYRIGAVGPGKVSLAAKFDNADVLVQNCRTNALYITAPWDGAAWAEKPFGALSVGSTYGGGDLVFEDAGYVNFRDVSVQVGSWPNTGFSPGRMIVKGNTVLSQTYELPLANVTSKLKIGAGWGYAGVVDIRDGAVITNRPDIGTGSESVGALLLNGGTFYSTAGANNDNQIGGPETGTDANSHGYIEVNSGSMILRGWFHIGVKPLGRGVMYQKGGLFRVDDKALNIGRGGTGVVYQTGGTLDSTVARAEFAMVNSATWQTGTQSGGSGALTIDGESAYAGFNTLYLSGRSKGVAYLNVLDRGVLGVKNIMCPTNVVAGSAAVRAVPLTDNRAYVHIDGGVLRSRASGELFGTGVFLPTRVTVGPEGAVFDTDGNDVSVSAAISDSGDGGVTSLALPEGELTGYYAAPLVVISGDGTGATAVAEYDSETLTVTGVKVTSPGRGYTAENTTAYIDWCGHVKQDKVPLAVTVGKPASGGIVKRGAGRLTLKETNAFGGDITIEGGTVRLAADGALPAGARVITKGGALEVASGDAAPSSITVGLDPDSLVRGTKYTLAEFPDGVPESLPSVVWPDGVAPAYWEPRLKGNRLMLVFVPGFVINVR